MQGTKAHVGGWDGWGGGGDCSKFDVGKEGKENHVLTKGTSTATSGTPLDVHRALLFTGEDLLRGCRGS